MAAPQKRTAVRRESLARVISLIPLVVVGTPPVPFVGQATDNQPGSSSSFTIALSSTRRSTVRLFKIEQTASFPPITFHSFSLTSELNQRGVDGRVPNL
jgi:hypothetical protein